MALGEAVLGEALDLRVQPVGELLRDPPLGEAAREALAVRGEVAVLLPRRHVPPQAIGLAPRVPRPHDGDLHHLLLEERYTERAIEDGAEEEVGRVYRLLSVSPAEVRVNHPPLDGPGPHDRHLHDEVVELHRLEAREHRHLRAALDLKDAHRVRAAEGVVHLGVLGGDTGQLLDRRHAANPLVVLNEGERLPDRGEHPQAEDVDLEEAERVEIVLVPGDDRAAGHRRRLDGSNLHERCRREHEAADVDRQVARKALDPPRHGEDEPDARVVRVEAGVAEARGSGRSRRVPVRDDGAQSIDLLERQPEHLPHLAQRRLPSVRDDLAHHRRAVAAVLLVDGLDDLFPAFVLEVDVDVRRLVPLGGEEALEEEVGTRRVHRGDAERVAHRAVRRAPAPLAEDVAAPGHLDDRLHAEEVRSHVQLGDERELLFDLRRNGRRDVATEIAARALVREPAERVVGGLAGIFRIVELAGEVVVELAELKACRRRR